MTEENKLTIEGTLTRPPYPGASLAKIAEILMLEILKFEYDPDSIVLESEKNDEDAGPEAPPPKGKLERPFERPYDFQIKKDGEFVGVFYASQFFNRHGKTGIKTGRAIVKLLYALERKCGVSEEEVDEKLEVEGLIDVAYFSRVKLDK